MKREQKEALQKIALKHGTPLFVVDHEIIRQNYREFTEKLPDAQVYFAIKSNSHPDILKTMYDIGSSFDVASIQEFRMVYKNIRHLSEKKRQEFIWDKMIYANTIKPAPDLAKLSRRMMGTFDNIEELKKIKKFAPKLGLILRLRVPNTGSMVELSSKFGADSSEAVDLMVEAIRMGLEVGGISFHVGSQCNNFENYIQALNLTSAVFKEAKLRGLDIGFNEKDGTKEKILDIGGGFPVRYTSEVKSFTFLARKLNSEIKRLFGNDNIKVIAEPGRFMVATACTLVTKIIGKSVRDEKTCYYLDDGVYHTFSGQIYDHQRYPLHSFKEGEKKIVSTFGPTCDAFDTISLMDELPEDLELDDLLYTENIGAYTFASATYFNGFRPPKVVHINKEPLTLVETKVPEPALASATI